MSKQAPHNASVEVVNNGIREYVRKRYYAKYTALDELRAHRDVVKLLEGVCGIRAVKIYEIDVRENTLIMEYIPGLNLYEIIMKKNIRFLDECISTLINLFVRARDEDIRFDSDPSNLLYDERDGQIVIIDPVCVDLDIEDFTMIVFLWGLIKIITRNPDFWLGSRIFNRFFIFYREYLKSARMHYRNLNRQMTKYIDVVIRWNKEKHPDEGLSMRFIRNVVLVPISSIIKRLFQWNLIRP